MDSSVNMAEAGAEAKEASPKKHIYVSGAVIIRDNGAGSRELFATQRGYGPWKGWWEFPGGKLEAGETPAQCIVREIREELATEVLPGNTVGVVEYDYPEYHVTMYCILCTVVSGKLTLLEHDDSTWLSKESLFSVKWLPSDLKILPAISQLL